MSNKNFVLVESEAKIIIESLIAQEAKFVILPTMKML